jgi:thioredoxin-like negative regulator of GroEL
MDPLATAVATAVTRFLVVGVSGLGSHVGAVAADAARTLAHLVLDRLGDDPERAETVARYRANPQATQSAIEAALATVLAGDPLFAAELQEVLADYDPDWAGGHSRSA